MRGDDGIRLVSPQRRHQLIPAAHLDVTCGGQLQAYGARHVHVEAGENVVLVEIVERRIVAVGQEADRDPLLQRLAVVRSPRSRALAARDAACQGDAPQQSPTKNKTDTARIVCAMLIRVPPLCGGGRGQIAMPSDGPSDGPTDGMPGDRIAGNSPCAVATAGHAGRHFSACHSAATASGPAPIRLSCRQRYRQGHVDARGKRRQALRRGHARGPARHGTGTGNLCRGPARRLGSRWWDREAALDLKTAEDAAHFEVAGIPAVIDGRPCRVLCADSRPPAELARQAAALQAHGVRWRWQPGHDRRRG